MMRSRSVNRDTAVPAEGNGETQTMSHIVKSRSLTKLNGGLSRLHSAECRCCTLQSADEDTVSLLTNYGSLHAYERRSEHYDSVW